ncbi:MAG: leucine-rich repeat domain-containing protein, partial [Ruminococcus sp.]|nr:leucine-rich repeat domain-containing protein [Ruminococcus sp.]
YPKKILSIFLTLIYYLNVYENKFLIDSRKCTGDVIIPDGVISIAGEAFYESNITSVIIPDSVMSIGNRAFSFCTNLKTVTLPNSITNISEYMFYRCYHLESVTIPDGVTEIKMDAFRECYDLTSVTIPDSVTEISDSAFSYCRSLPSITIPDSVTSIGNYAFYECESLTNITLSNNLTSIEESTFSKCSKLDSIDIPDSIEKIGKWAFSGCSSLTSITVPYSVTSIDEYAFKDCSGLTDITIKNPVCEIYDSNDTISNGYENNEYYFNGTINGYDNSTTQEYASKYNYEFLSIGTLEIEADLAYKLYDDYVEITGCNKDATKAVIPDTIEGLPVTKIGNSAFKECSRLINITIPDSVTSIGMNAFYNCKSLQSIIIPDSVTSINDYAFSNCSGIISITIPYSVTEINYYAFKGCASLESITIENPGCKIYDSYSTISNGYENDEYYFNGTINGYDDSTAQKYAEKYNYKFESMGVLEIEADFIYKTYDDYVEITGCNKDATKAVIPDTIDGLPVTSIGYSAFENNSNLKSIIIPDIITDISSCAFEGCSSLESITLPDTITNIASSVFEDCSSLESIIIPDSVTYIGSDAFSGCSNLKSITVPDSVTYIGSRAFYNCSSLESINIPDSVTSIGYVAFYNCSSLESINIPDSVISIEYYSFAGCSSLTSITIPDSVTYIDEYAFKGCSALEDIIIENPACEIYDSDATISNDIDENGEYYFNGTIHGYGDSDIKEYAEKYNYNFVSLGESAVTYKDLICERHIDYIKIIGCDENSTEIVIPDTIDGLPVTKIGSYAFSECEKLEDVTIPDSITSIDEGAFKNCSNLALINIPASVVYIGGGFSDGCTALTEINVDEKNTVYYSYDGALYKYEYKEYSYYGEETGTYNTLLVYPMGKQDKYTIKNGTEKIGAYAFEDCTGLTAVDIPDSVIKIGNGAFSGCLNLISITIPENVTEIGGAFNNGCTALEEINVDEKNNVYYSYNGALYKNQEISGYNYETDSYESAMYKSLLVCPEGKKDSYTVAEGTERISNYAFSGCENLVSINIPASVTYIGYYFCDNCPSLTEINVDEENTVYYTHDGGLYKNWETFKFNYE